MAKAATPKTTAAAEAKPAAKAPAKKAAPKTTAAAKSAAPKTAATGTVGHITQVIGAVVDVKFPEGQLPLILNDSNCARPTLDSTRLLARAALKRASAT